MSRIPRPGGAVGHRLLRFAITLLAIAVPVLAGTSARDSFWDGAHRTTEALSAERNVAGTFKDLRTELAGQVPAGSRVFPVPGTAASWDTQRLAEFATIQGLVVTATPSDADYLISVVADGPDLALHVERAR